MNLGDDFEGNNQVLLQMVMHFFMEKFNSSLQKAGNYGLVFSPNVLDVLQIFTRFYTSKISKTSPSFQNL